MDEQIFSDLEQKIEKMFSKKKKDRAVYDEHLELVKYNGDDDVDLFVSLSKVTMLIFRRPDFETLSSQDFPRVDINSPVVDGLFPLHLAVMTSSEILVGDLLDVYEAKRDVKCCGDPNSPFYGLTPLELALDLMRYLIQWTPQLSIHELLSMFSNEKAKLLLGNISALARETPHVRDLIFNYSLQGKVVEFAALMKVASFYDTNFSTMYIPTANLSPQIHFGVPMMTLRLLLASKSASLIKEGIQITASLNPEEDDNQGRRIKEMDSIRILLELAERGDLLDFDEKQKLSVELTDGSSEGSKDPSKVKTVAPLYLKNSLFYVEPSIYQPHGILNSMMPSGYYDSLDKYDGLDIRNGNALVETIFRVLDGRKVSELSLEDTQGLRWRLAFCFKNKFKEAETLTALEKKRAQKQAKEKKRSTTRSSLPRSGGTKRTTAALTPGGPCSLVEAFEHMDIKKLSSVFSAIKKGRA